MFSSQPKRPVGTIPRKDFFDPTKVEGTRVGIITRVDEINMKADVKILTGGGWRLEVDIGQAMAGPRSFWGGVPEVNSICILGFRSIHKNLNEAVILGFIPVGNRSGLRFDPFTAVDPAEVADGDEAIYRELVGPTIRYKRLLMKPGNVGGMSSDGAELVLSKDVAMTNRAGDLLELRDSERTLVAQAIHRVQTESGVRLVSGPARRSAFFLPPDILKEDGTLKEVTEDYFDSDNYFGRDELQAAGPGTEGEIYRFADSSGNLNSLFNSTREFPAVVYSNGKQVHYPPSLRPDLSLEDPNSPADALVEHRMEMSHTSNLTHEVLEQVDGFSSDRRPPYIERVYGTVVGNDMTSSRGQRQYGKILTPRIFSEFTKHGPGKFQLDEIDRVGAEEVDTTAGAFLFRIRPPRGRGDNHFVAAVTKEGKAILNVPASGSEAYASGTNKVSVEANLAGALKAYIGASTPDRISAHLTLAGGLHLDIGRDAQGNVITTNFRGAVRQTFTGNPNEEDAALAIEVKGIKKVAISGAEQKSISGSKVTFVNGLNRSEADRTEINSHSGYTLNTGEMNQLVAGKTQLNYALQVLENIVAGGKLSTILAGAKITNVLAGAMTYNVAAGATSFLNPAGAFSVNVGSGAINAATGAGAVAVSTAAGAMSLAAGAGAMSLASGLALNIAAGGIASTLGAVINLGGAATPGALGVARGAPALPPNAPTLDPITGSPVLGAAVVLAS
jgi:hypothetical protein